MNVNLTLLILFDFGGQLWQRLGRGGELPAEQHFREVGAGAAEPRDASGRRLLAGFDVARRPEYQYP